MPEGAGDWNIVVVGWQDVTQNVTSVTDSSGNTYSLGVAPVRSPSLSQALYYAPNIAAASNTVTVHFDNPATAPDVRALEYAGIAAFDQGLSATGYTFQAGNDAAPTPPVFTRSANELVLVGGTTQGDLSSGIGFTSRVVTTPGQDLVEDELVSEPGAYAGVALVGYAPITHNGEWVLQIATFQPQVCALSISDGGTSDGGIADAGSPDGGGAQPYRVSCACDGSSGLPAVFLTMMVPLLWAIRRRRSRSLRGHDG
jgi:hypothetical protein